MTAALMMDAPTLHRADAHADTNPLALSIGMLAEEVRAEGWGWVEVQIDGAAFDTRRYGMEAKAQREPTAEEADMLARLDSVRARLVSAYNLNEELSDPLSEAYCAEEQRLSSAIDEIEDRIEAARLALGAWAADQMARLGALLCIDAMGDAIVHRGLYRRDAHVQAGTPARSGQRHAFSADLMRDLTAHRTAAIQAALTQNTRVAFVALVHRMAETLFERYGRGNDVVKVRFLPTSDVTLSEDATGYKESPAGWMMHCAGTQWADLLPGTSEAMFAWLLVQDQTTLLSLLAYCTARSINAVSGAERTYDHSDAIAQALGLDMADWWMPTAGNYLGQVTRRQAVQAVHQATGLDCSGKVAGMKRAEAIQYLAAKLEETRWLPAPLLVLERTLGSHEEDERGSDSTAINA